MFSTGNRRCQGLQQLGCLPLPEKNAVSASAGGLQRWGRAAPPTKDDLRSRTPLWRVGFPRRVVTGVVVGISPLCDGRFSAEATRACPALVPAPVPGGPPDDPQRGIAAPPAHGPQNNSLLWGGR